MREAVAEGGIGGDYAQRISRLRAPVFSRAPLALICSRRLSVERLAILQQVIGDAGEARRLDVGKLLGLRIGLAHERAVAEWCEEAIEALLRQGWEGAGASLESLDTGAVGGGEPVHRLSYNDPYA